MDLAPLVAARKARVPEGRRAGLHATLLERLRDLIVEGELAAGARVPERALCERFGVSRTPLREALKAVAEHELILQALAARDGARLAKLLRSHLDNKSYALAAQSPEALA